MSQNKVENMATNVTLIRLNQQIPANLLYENAKYCLQCFTTACQAWEGRFFYLHLRDTLSYQPKR